MMMVAPPPELDISEQMKVREKATTEQDTCDSNLELMEIQRQCLEGKDSDISSELSSEEDQIYPCETMGDMHSHEIVKIDTGASDPKTVQDYLSVCALMARLPGMMVYDSLLNLFAGQNRRPFRDALLDSMMGRCYRSSTLTQLRIMCGLQPLHRELTNPLYWLGGVRALPNYNTEFAAPGCVARWICEVPDRKPEDPVCLYLHGGGYALKTCQPQIDYIMRLAKVMRLTYPRISVLILDYTIAPFVKFPTQRKQAVACMRALQQSCNNIVLLGDSCGGNLALSMLLEETVIKYEKILGCMLVSPWVDPAAQTGSMNSKRDILSKQRLNEMTAQFVDPELLEDPRVTPLKADPEVWKRVLPKNVACVWGAFECLADQVAEFQKVANIENYYIEHNGTHDCILRGLKPKPCKYITKQILDWLSSTQRD